MLRWLKESARRGHPLAQTSLSVLYMAGDGGVPRDAVEAYYWWVQAAAQGESDAVAAVADVWGNLSDEEQDVARQVLSLPVAARKHPGSDPQTSSFSAQIICQ